MDSSVENLIAMAVFTFIVVVVSLPTVYFTSEYRCRSTFPYYNETEMARCITLAKEYYALSAIDRIIKEESRR